MITSEKLLQLSLRLRTLSHLLVSPGSQTSIPMTERTPGEAVPTHLSQLDGLRAIAVMIVLWQHAGSGRSTYFGQHGVGVYGVWLFFVLSGFLITAILLRARASLGTGRVSRGRALYIFYARRVLRIFPAYYLVLGLAWVAGLYDMHHLIWWQASYLVNWVMVERGRWLGFGPSWSLCVEEQFYILWPLLILTIAQKRLAGFFLMFVILGPVLRGLLYMVIPASTSVLVATTSCLDPLAAGALLAWAYHTHQPTALRRRWCNIAGIFGCSLVIALAALQLLHTGALLQNLFEATAATGISVWVIDRAVTGFSGVTGQVLQCAPLTWLGTISYGMYLYHGLVLSTLDRVGYRDKGLVAFLVTVGATTAVATVSWYAFERPLSALKKHFTYH
jgi:peptidoglycan/LPS O-acetylase OafA/YrhL